MPRNNSFQAGRGTPVKPPKEEEAWYDTARREFNDTDKGEVARSLTGGAVADVGKRGDTWMPDWLDENGPQELNDFAKGTGQAGNLVSNIGQGIFYGAKNLGQFSLSQLTKNPFDRESMTNASGLVDNPYSSNPSGKGNAWDNAQRPALEFAALLGPKGISGVGKAGKAAVQEGAAAVKRGASELADVVKPSRVELADAKAARAAAAGTGKADMSRASIEGMGAERALAQDSKLAASKAPYTRDVTPVKPSVNDSSSMALKAKKAVAGAMIGLSAMSPTAGAVAAPAASVVKTIPRGAEVAAKALDPIADVAFKTGKVSKVLDNVTPAQSNVNTTSARAAAEKAAAAEKTAAKADNTVAETGDEVTQTLHVPTTVTVPSTQTQTQTQTQTSSSSDTFSDGTPKPKPNERIKPRNTPDAAPATFSGDETSIPLTA